MFLGIEIGGTKLQLGVGPGNGSFESFRHARIEPAGGAEGILRQLVEMVPLVLRDARIVSVDAIGVGFGGPTDDDTQTVITSHQVAGWDGFPLAEWLRETFGVRAVICNDADVAGLAEARLGAGSGLSPVFYMTIGSGIGGGLVIDGKVYRGVGRGAAEVGHLRMPETLESLASGWGIERRTGTDAKSLGEAAAAGDERAVREIEVACGHLADAICHVIALLCPRRIVIGGGVSLMGDVLFLPLRRLVAERVFRPFAGLTDIVPAALGESVVVHGAIVLARQWHEA